MIKRIFKQCVFKLDNFLVPNLGNLHGSYCLPLGKGNKKQL